MSRCTTWISGRLRFNHHVAQYAYLAILKQSVEKGNGWRMDDPEFRPNFPGATLEKANLGGANLRGANLRNAKLHKVDLGGADLIGVDFGGADLGGANLIGADLCGAYLRETNLNRANLRNAKLHKVDLGGADLIGVDFGGADLNNANLRDADLTEADLNNANLNGASLQGATLIKTNVSETNLTRASIGSTSFADVDLSVAKGLETVQHRGPSFIDIHTLYKSKGNIPDVFLRGAGVPDDFIAYIPSFAGRPIEYYSCFISYSHADKSFARRLHDALQGQGIRCWVDEHQLLPGDPIYDTIDRGIRLWDKVLLCCSESSLNSWWVENEVTTAFDKEQQLRKERGEPVWALIPLNLDGYMFGGWHRGWKQQIMNRLAADFTGWQNDNAKFEQQLERVVKALRTGDGGREPAPPSKLGRALPGNEQQTSSPIFAQAVKVSSKPTPIPSSPESQYAFNRAILQRCDPNGNTTCVKGTVYKRGQPVNGYWVAFSYEPGGPVVAMAKTKSHQGHQGFYSHILDFHGPRQGDWFLWIIDSDGNRISRIAHVHTAGQAGEGRCQQAVIDFDS